MRFKSKQCICFEHQRSLYSCWYLENKGAAHTTWWGKEGTAFGNVWHTSDQQLALLCCGFLNGPVSTKVLCRGACVFLERWSQFGPARKAHHLVCFSETLIPGKECGLLSLCLFSFTLISFLKWIQIWPSGSLVSLSIQPLVVLAFSLYFTLSLYQIKFKGLYWHGKHVFTLPKQSEIDNTQKWNKHLSVQWKSSKNNTEGVVVPILHKTYLVLTFTWRVSEWGWLEHFHFFLSSPLSVAPRYPEGLQFAVPRSRVEGEGVSSCLSQCVSQSMCESVSVCVWLCHFKTGRLTWLNPL